jgi:hypothetical protein
MLKVAGTALRVPFAPWVLVVAAAFCSRLLH